MQRPAWISEVSLNNLTWPKVALGGVLAVGSYVVAKVSCDMAWEARFYFKQWMDKGTPVPKVNKVCVIGAGASGICSAKEMMAAGMDVTVFEQSEDIGGLWVYRKHENHSSVYWSTFINTSRQVMAFSDFPMRHDLPTYPHHRQIVKYFNDYADNFGVKDRIRFNKQVVSVTPINSDRTRWKVTYKNSDGTPMYMLNDHAHKYINPSPDLVDVASEEFDAVVVASGHHCEPKWPPKFPGQDKFKGNIIHSHQYKDPSSHFDYREKNVLVIGIGNSGADIATELSYCANQVYVSTRSGAYILPRYALGKPVDHNDIRFWPFLIPFKLEFALLRWLLVDHAQISVKRFGIKPEFSLFSAHPTVSHDLLNRALNGSVCFKRHIKCFEENGVTFMDGTTVHVDAVVFATGYHIRFPFIPETILKVEDNRVDAYRNCLLSDAPPTLAFVGLVQPLGAIMPISELQARWLARIWSGKLKLPSKDYRDRSIRSYRKEVDRRYHRSSRHTIQVDARDFMDLLARDIGCFPHIFRNPLLFREIMFGVNSPSQYRLNGPGKWSEAAAELKRIYSETNLNAESSISQLATA